MVIGSIMIHEIQDSIPYTRDISPQDGPKKMLMRKVLESTPGLILLGISFLLQTMPSSYMPVILKNEFDIPESTSAFIISAST